MTTPYQVHIMGNPPVVFLWGKSRADALARGAMHLRRDPGDCRVKATGLTDSRKLASTRYAVRPKR